MDKLILIYATSSMPLATGAGYYDPSYFYILLASLAIGAALIILFKWIFITTVRAVVGLFVPPEL